MTLEEALPTGHDISLKDVKYGTDTGTDPSTGSGSLPGGWADPRLWEPNFPQLLLPARACLRGNRSALTARRTEVTRGNWATEERSSGGVVTLISQQ